MGNNRGAWGSRNDARIVMTKRPGFIRLFATGFALGAAGLVGVQAAQNGPQSVIATAQAATR